MWATSLSNLIDNLTKGIHKIKWKDWYCFIEYESLKKIEWYERLWWNKGLPYLKHWDLNNLYGWSMSQKLPVNKFEWIQDTFQFNENFIKSCNEESNEVYFLEVDVQCYVKVWKRKKSKSLLLICMMKLNMSFTKKKLKQALNHRLVLKKVHIVTKFNENAWLSHILIWIVS